MNLTTAQLAERTGVAAGTLRVWQARHGFPASVGAGDRRPAYREADVRAIENLLRLRAEGLSMAAAVARVQAASPEMPTSIYAGLRASRPELQPRTLHKRALLALTHAIEDEYAAYAGDGLLIGSFQEVRHYRASERRWRELARPTFFALAMADFPRVRMRQAAPLEIPVSRTHPHSREWTLIACSREAQACLAAWEIPEAHTVRDGERRFEFVWSFDPAVVASAVAIATELLRALAPSVAERLHEWDATNMTGPAASFGADLAGRAVAYVATSVRAPHPRAAA